MQYKNNFDSKESTELCIHENHGLFLPVNILMVWCTSFLDRTTHYCMSSFLLKVYEYLNSKYYTSKDYKTTQNLLICNAHDKTKIFVMISVWTNPTVIFILIGAQTMEQSQVKHELSFCARVLLGNIRRIFLLKNLGYWNAYY